MKTSIYTLFIFILFSFPLYGQLQKGDISLQGNLGLGYQWSASTAEGISLPINPSVAFMVSDNWLLGAALGTGVMPGDDLGDNGLLQPFVRYYFNPELIRTITLWDPVLIFFFRMTHKLMVAYLRASIVSSHLT
ncbi:MAG: hypothetical protein AAGJ93_09060 [Bacteroidota bacterium]